MSISARGMLGSNFIWASGSGGSRGHRSRAASAGRSRSQAVPATSPELRSRPQFTLPQAGGPIQRLRSVDNGSTHRPRHHHRDPAHHLPVLEHRARAPRSPDRGPHARSPQPSRRSAAPTLCGSASRSTRSPPTAGAGEGTLIEMSPRHILLCHSSGYGDAFLSQAAELCRASRAKLTVVLPVVDVRAADGCCGIQGDQWRRLMDEADREAGLRALDVLDRMGCRPQHVAVEVGPSLPQIAQRAAERAGCDTIAVGRRRWPWSSGLSRRRLAKLRAGTMLPVLELPRRERAVEPPVSNPAVAVPARASRTG